MQKKSMDIFHRKIWVLIILFIFYVGVYGISHFDAGVLIEKNEIINSIIATNNSIKPINITVRTAPSNNIKPVVANNLTSVFVASTSNDFLVKYAPSIQKINKITKAAIPPTTKSIIISGVIILTQSIDCKDCQFVKSIPKDVRKSTKTKIATAKVTTTPIINIINPYKLSKEVNKKIKNPEYSDYLDYDLRKLAEADEIYFCKGWRKSHGCNKEYQMAVASNIMILGHVWWKL